MGKGDLQGAAEKSLTTSELQNLIRDSVREANLDIIDRIERVENRLDQVEHNRLRGLRPGRRGDYARPARDESPRAQRGPAGRRLAHDRRAARSPPGPGTGVVARRHTRDGARTR